MTKGGLEEECPRDKGPAVRVCKVNTKKQEQVSWSWVYKDIESGRQVRDGGGEGILPS